MIKQNLDERLTKTVEPYLLDGEWVPKLVAEIKQAYLEELELGRLIQDMVNMRANMQQDMIRLGLTSTPTSKGTNE